MATPMTAAEELDLDGLDRSVDYLIASGVHGLLPLGSTGEYYALSAEERTTVVRRVIERAAGRVPVVVGANGGSTRDVVAYSREAERLGAAGLLLAAPYYSLPTPDELFEHFRTVDAAVGIPIILYNYPGRTGVDLKPDQVERLAGLKNVRYIKESSGEVQRMSEIIRRCGDRLKVFCGCDTAALESFLLGAVGWVGGAANFAPEIHTRLFELAVTRRDFAAATSFFYQILPLMTYLEDGGRYTQYVKAGCALRGLPVGPPRRPLLPAGAEEVESLRRTIEGVLKALDKPS